MKSSFSSSSPDDVTVITATDVVLADNAGAPAKDDSQEEAADGTAGADGLSNALATMDEGGGSFLLIIINRGHSPIEKPVIFYFEKKTVRLFTLHFKKH